MCQSLDGDTSRCSRVCVVPFVNYVVVRVCRWLLVLPGACCGAGRGINTTPTAAISRHGTSTNMTARTTIDRDYRRDSQCRRELGVSVLQNIKSYSVNSRSEENFIRNTSLFGPRLEYVFRNTSGIRPSSGILRIRAEYSPLALGRSFGNTWNTYSHSRNIILTIIRL